MDELIRCQFSKFKVKTVVQEKLIKCQKCDT